MFEILRRTRPVSLVLALTMLLASPIALPGCSAGGGKAGKAAATRTVGSLERVQKTLVSGQTQLYTLSGHVAEAVSPDATDANAPLAIEPPSWFATFTKQRTAARKLSQRLSSDLKRFRTERDAYVAGWESDLSRVTDPELRAMARERRMNLNNRFDEVGNKLSEADQQMGPLLEQLDNLHIYLSNDLTPVGFAAMQSRLEEASQTAAILGDRFDDLAADVEDLAQDVGPRLSR